MSSPLQVLKDGIINGNWDTVCAGYKQLTGEPIDPPAVKPLENSAILNQVLDLLQNPTVKREAKSAPVVNQKQTQKKVSKKTSKKVGKVVKVAKSTKKIIDEDNVFDSDQPLGISTSERGPVNAKKRKMNFPTEVLYNPLEEQDNAEKKVKKIKRHSYKALMRACSECKSQFDFNKAYPVGKLDGQTKSCLCEDCQVKRN